MITKIGIKFGNENPSDQVLRHAISDINSYLGRYQTVSYHDIDGKYIYFNLEHSDIWDNSSMVQHMLTGYLMAKGVEII